MGRSHAGLNFGDGLFDQLYRFFAMTILVALGFDKGRARVAQTGERFSHARLISPD
jgi:hypothetical protein